MRKRIVTTGIVAGLSMWSSGLAGADAGSLESAHDIDRHTHVELSDRTPVRAFERDGRLMSVYGRPLARGATAQASVDAFVAAQAEHLFGVPAGDLEPGVRYADGAPVKGLMYDHAAGRYRSLLHRFTQVVDGIPVYASELKVLVRNRPGFPVVLANSSLHDLGGFRPAGDAAQRARRAAALDAAARELGAGAYLVEPPTPIIWAGTADAIDVPRLGARFVAGEGRPDTAAQQLVMLIIDPDTGEVIFRESQIHHADVTGNVSGWATEPYAADICVDQALTPLPYARVSIGSTVVFADVNGNFVIPNPGSDPVTVESTIRGPWFEVFNSAGPEAQLEQTVDPPGPADFVHNPSSDEFTTAEVNCYIHANEIRDYVLALDPDFPIVDDTEFRVNVNVSGSCNAFYNGGSINFFWAAGSCPNEGFSIVVYHEYGHHLVARATGSQCQWGEGNSDVAGVQVSDTPENAIGFGGNCEVPLRNADNDCQYDPLLCASCGGPCHGCGQLISGCSWSLRNELLATEPADYRTIGGQLWLASLFLHVGTGITPQDTINYLMADDDDETIENGSPHFDEIAAAFGDHNMAAPPIIYLEFTLPDGAPAMIDPAGGDTIRLSVTANIGSPRPDSGVLYFDDGGTPTAIDMVEVETNVYEGTFPATPCGGFPTYYFSVETTEDVVEFFPRGAPDDDASRFGTVAALEVTVEFNEDFEQGIGWEVTDMSSAGEWERAVPVGCNEPRQQPDADADGSGSCYLTQNNPDPSSCFTDVDFGSTILTSPILDASNPDAAVAYSRWFSNDRFVQNVDDAFLVEFSEDGGATWSVLETVGPEPPGTQGGWIFQSFRLADVLSAPTSQFRLRFTASDTGGPSDVEAAVDAVQFLTFTCDACPEDLDDSGAVDFGDILTILSAWGPCGKDCPEDLDGSGAVDFGDVLAVLAAWGDCG